MEYIKAKIKSFFANSLHYELQDHEDIFALGFVKSIFILQLILFLEEEFGITIEKVHLCIDDFRTVNRIAHLVECRAAVISSCAFSAATGDWGLGVGDRKAQSPIANP